MMVPRLSILLPVFNGGRFLAGQLRSISEQTDDDFEVLVVDDGSTDDSLSVVRAHASTDTRFTLVPADGNVGQLGRLRQLLTLARAPHVAFADQDDVWAADRNARLMAAIGDRALAFGRSDLIDAQGRTLGPTLLDTLGLTPDPAMRVRALFKPLVSAHAAIARRDWIDPAVFAHPLPFDWLLGTSAMLADSCVYVDEAVIAHRLHQANQMNRTGPDTRRRLAALRNRYAFLLRRPTQLRFWLMLDYLGRATALADRRHPFIRLALACRDAWFGGVPSWRWEDPALRTLLRDNLLPLAGSPDDQVVGGRQINLLTRAIAHPAKIAEAIRRRRTRLEQEF